MYSLLNRHFLVIFAATLVIMMLTNACYYTNAIPIEVLQYPKSPLPNTTKSIAFVDKTCPPDRDSIGFFYTLDQQKMYSEFPSDSILSTSFINGMKSIIDQSGFFSIDTTTLLFNDFSYDKKHKKFQLQQPTNADIIIVLDQLTIKDVTAFYPSSFEGIFGQILLYMNSNIQIFSVADQTLLKEIHYQDTVEWSNIDNTAQAVYQSLPKRYEVFPEAYFWMGSDVAQNFCPYWMEVERLVYNSYFSTLLQYGTNAALRHQWQRAYNYWKDVTKQKNKQMAANAYFNLALFEEIQGNMSAALQNIEKARSLHDKESFQEYHQILKSETQKIEFLNLLKSKN
ncbi:MAG: DUF6340 family protein [Bacteroidales bacterium]|nr:DUF6340 family protein [Bacteroidales bacterium]